ncbi:hypothetical protein ACS0VI_10750 [Streptomyces sp. H28]|uniref:hypothetical protein n=1 Tax=Streptomyces sp. H28 TaxID=2775865 RepID=UPI001CE03002|nr:hypothetical protein [Streptomyces sp. H28]
MAVDEHHRASLQSHWFPEAGDAGGQFFVLHRVEAMPIGFKRLGMDALLPCACSIMSPDEASWDDIGQFAGYVSEGLTCPLTG